MSLLKACEDTRWIQIMPKHSGRKAKNSSASRSRNYARFLRIEGKTQMANGTKLGGTFTFSDQTMIVNRMGYGAMQLAGPQVWGPPRDVDAAIAVLREAVEAGVNHIDTSDYYGPQVTNQIIKRALHPYPEDLHIVTKVGAVRDSEGGWHPALGTEQLRQAVQDNLGNLGLDALDVVNLRVGGFDRPE